MSEKEAYVAFNLTGCVGSVKVAELTARFGSVSEAYARYPAKVSRTGGPVDVEREFALAKKYGIEILTPADESYPEMLAGIPGRPLAIYVKGDPKVLSKPSVSIVGTRRATPYGLDQAYRISRDLAAAGWSIVSGLAVGIDARAHRGALDALGITVGVLGSALDEFYPAENRELAREIVAKGGAVISEFPFGRQPDQQTFPQRNHIVAGLSRGVVAIEAAIKSGTLITTAIAADLGRTVMAVPGRVDARSSAGCLALIRDGARLVRNARDVEDELSFLHPQPDAAERKLFPPGFGEKAKTPEAGDAIPQPKFSIEESIVMRHVDEDGITLDSLVEKTGLSASSVNSTCMGLRVKGRVRFLPGNRVASC